MATKRPVSVQKIPNSGSTESNATQAAATNANLPSNVNLQNATVEPTNAAIEGGLDRPTTEETIAEETSAKQDLGRTTPDVGDAEGGPNPVDTLPGRPSFNLADDPKGADTQPGPDASIPGREELKEEFVNEVGMHPVGAGEEGPPTDPQEARDFFAEHGKGSMISGGATVITEDKNGPNEIKRLWSDGSIETDWTSPDGSRLVITKFADGKERRELFEPGETTPKATRTNMPDGTVVENQGGTTSVTKNGTTTTVDKDGNVIERTEPLPDGDADLAKKGANPKQPGSDDEYVVPEEVKEAIDGELGRLNELTGRELDPSSFHGASPNETQPTENDDAFGTGGGKGSDDASTKGSGGAGALGSRDAVESKKDNLLGGDNVDQTPGGTASAGEVQNPNEWAINYGPDHADPQSIGREREMFENDTIESDWSNTNNDDTPDDTGASPFAPPVVDSHYDDVPEEVAYDPAN